MFDHHALRPAGRTRGVDHVAERARREFALRPDDRRDGLLGEIVLLGIEPQQRRLQFFLDAIGERVFRNDQPKFGILRDGTNTVERPFADQSERTPRRL